MKQERLPAAARELTGKGACRKMRNQGNIPAVLYGEKQPVQNLSICKTTFLDILRKHDTNFLVELYAEDNSMPESLAVVKDIASHPVTRKLLHVDFLRVSEDIPVTTVVPLHLTGLCYGVKMGGRLEAITREVEIAALPRELPEFIDVDVTALDVGDILHMSDVVAPAGVMITDALSKVVASVHGKESETEEPAATADATGEEDSEE